MTRTHRVVGLVLVAALGILGACGSDDDDASDTADSAEPGATTGGDASTDDSSSGSDDPAATDDSTASSGVSVDGETIESGMVGEQSEAEPTDGGELTFGVYAETSGLDPTVSTGGGTAGGIELAAIYDTLMRYNPESGEYEPQLAKSLQANADSTQFTLTLRDGVEFTDGTPLDAEAVVASMKRHTELQSRFAPVVASIKSYKTPDPSTVVFELTEPWVDFPYVLSTSPGMITSPTAVDELGDEAFNNEPVGAGPFTLDRWAPDEELRLVANEDYWNGRPHLDAIRFVAVLGGQSQLDALRSGDLDGTFLRDPAAITTAREEGFAGYRNNLSLGTTLLVNHGAEGQDRIGGDVRVRLAMAYAVDPEVIDERTNQGTGIPSRDVVSPTSPYHDQGSTITYDADKASELVDEVKAETGWDGSIEIVGSNDPAGSTRTLAVSGMLEAVGFKPKITGVPSVDAIISRVVEGKFDIASWGYNVDDSSPYEAFELHLGIDSPTNFTKFKSPELQGLIHDLKLAEDTASRTDALNAIQVLFDEEMPVVPLGPTMEFVAWNDDVHGIRPSVKTMVLFDQAFVAG